MMKRRKTTILDDPDLGVQLSWYPPGEVMDEHFHEAGQVSVLFSGTFREISDARTADNQTGYVGFKPAGLKHANRYGDHGALILSINLADELAGEATGWTWRAAMRDELALARRVAIGGSPTDEIRDTAHDLVSLIFARPVRDHLPARWALQLRDQLADGESADLEAAARRIGIHRAHLSRGFRQWFGVPPSVFALRCRMSRAVGELARGEPAAHAAHAAGFADQSHLIRTLRRETGLTPRQLTGLIAA